MKNKKKRLKFLTLADTVASHRGNILVENVIFIILNLLFFTILILFLFSKVENAAVLEEKYAKQIALMIDSARPGTEIHFNVKQILDDAKDEKWTGKIIDINKNIVIVRLREKGGYPYSFFNDVDVTAYPDTTNNEEYVIIINEKGVLF